MEADTADLCSSRNMQTAYLKRFVLRRMARRTETQADSDTWGREIALRFMECPSLENVHHLCLFYGKIFLYPLWFKVFSRLFDAARPRAQVRELLSSQE